MNTTFSTSKILFFLLLFISTAAIFHSCIKEQQFIDTPLTPINGNTYTPNPQDEIITTSILGLVVDENENPVPNNEVSLQTINGIRTTTTDIEGNFLYTNVMVSRNRAVLEVNQEGKFDAFRKMSLTRNSYNYTKIKLLDKTILGSLPAIEGGTLQDISSTAKLELSPNSVQQENGENYAGTVEVAMSWIDPTAEDLAARMVGDLSGIDVDGKQVALGTFGMLNVELLGENGQELQLKEGMPATLSFPVPNEVLEQAPPTIPLWSFDEELGTWIEESFAVLENGFYVGEVGHFSSWNVDTKTDPISVRGKVFVRMGENELAAPYLQVYVNIEGVQVGGFLDDSGEFEFYNFPANTVFTLSILDNCGDILWEEELEPYAGNTDLGTFVIQGEGSSFVTISGSGVDCGGNPLENGYVKFELGEAHFLYPLEEGHTFEFVVNICDQYEGEIYLIDVVNEKISFSQAVILSAEFIELSPIAVCDELGSFMDVDINGEDGGYFINLRITHPHTNSLLIAGDIDYSLGYGVGLFWQNKDDIEHTGVQEIDMVIFEPTSPNPELNQPVIIPIKVEITQYGNDLGDIIRGAFYEEEINPETGEITYPISGSFKAIVQ